MHSLNPSELKALLDTSGPATLLLDVREPWEYAICHIAGCKSIPMGQIPSRMGELDPNANIVVICHHGIRSREIAQLLEQAGFTDVANLQGGIDAWAREIDPEMALY
jgi:rhodanese-related sulfurtransferase